MARASMSWMRARAKALSVRMRTWWPSSDTAWPPSAWMASASRPTVTCSPVEAMTSSSRSSGSGAICLARPEQAVGLARHRRDDHDHVVPLALRREAAPRDVADALDGADRRAAVFLNDQQGARTLQHRHRRRQDRDRRRAAVSSAAMAERRSRFTSPPPTRSRPPRWRATLVDEGLCACVNIVHGGALDLPLRRQDLRRARGAVRRQDAPRAVRRACEARVRELHPYEVPEILAFDVDEGSAAYLAWLRASTNDPGA